MKTPIRTGLIGADLSLRAGMVTRHLDPSRAVIAAVCDRDPEMLRRFHETCPEQSGCTDYADYRGLVRDPSLDVHHGPRPVP